MYLVCGCTPWIKFMHTSLFVCFINEGKWTNHFIALRRTTPSKDDESKSSSKANELGLSNVGGVFVVLLAGMGLASVVAVCEFVWKSRKLATEEHASVWTEMSKELKVALSCDTPSKPIRKDMPEQENGTSYLSLNTYGTPYTTSQYSFPCKEPLS